MIPSHLAGGINPCACGAETKHLDLDSTSSIPDKQPMMWRLKCHACGKRSAAMNFVDKAITAWNMVNPTPPPHPH